MTAFDAGAMHRCAVTAGGLRCWGANLNGQVGNGATADQLTPTEIFAAGSDVRQVVVDGAETSGYTCARIADGVRCWGRNISGELGDGTGTSSSSPVEVFPPGSGVTQICSAPESVCAVVNEGVRCWGSNAWGEVGDPALVSHLLPFEVMPAGSGVTAASVSYTNGCAIVAGGLTCWGDNSCGQLGNGFVGEPLGPTEIFPSGSGVTEVQVEDGTIEGNICAVVSSVLFCWGCNDSGLLGLEDQSRGALDVVGF